jgi:uncharacterized membrane protein HdeD (DUF308 family)
MDIWDFLVLLGAILCAAGLWLVYQPAALIFVGLFLVVGGIAGARAKARGNESKEG